MKKTISILFLIVLLLIVVSGYLLFFKNNINSTQQVKVQNKTEKAISSDKDKIKIFAVGDSLTAGYGLPENESYPKQLEKILQDKNYDLEVINMGISGETTAGLLERIYFINSQVNNQDKSIVLITIGGNDALRVTSIETIEKNIQNILKNLKEKIKKENIILFKIQAPANLGLAYKKRFDIMYEKIGTSEGVKVVDFVDPQVFLDSSLMLPDGIHPNKQGYKVLIDKYILSALLKIII